MTLDQLYVLIMAAAPALTTILGVVLAVIKIIKSTKNTNKEVLDKFEEVRQEIFNTKEYEDLKAQLLVAHQENIALKKTINELLTKIDHISRD